MDVGRDSPQALQTVRNEEPTFKRRTRSVLKIGHAGRISNKSFGKLWGGQFRHYGEVLMETSRGKTCGVLTNDVSELKRDAARANKYGLGFGE
jgi:hypothetical protein